MDRWLGSGIVLAALLLYFWIIPSEIVAPKFQVGGGVGGIAASPLFFPRLMAALLGVLGVFLFLRGHKRERNVRDGEGFVIDLGELVRVAGASAILIALRAAAGNDRLSPAHADRARRACASSSATGAGPC